MNVRITAMAVRDGQGRRLLYGGSKTTHSLPDLMNAPTGVWSHEITLQRGILANLFGGPYDILARYLQRRGVPLEAPVRYGRSSGILEIRTKNNRYRCKKNRIYPWVKG